MAERSSTTWIYMKNEASFMLNQRGFATHTSLINMCFFTEYAIVYKFYHLQNL